MQHPVNADVHAIYIVGTQFGEVRDAIIEGIRHTHFLQDFAHLNIIFRFKLRDGSKDRKILTVIQEFTQMLAGQAVHIL